MSLWDEMIRYFDILNSGCMVCCESEEKENFEIEQLTAEIQKKYGSSFPVFQYEAQTKTPTQKEFYSSLLDATNCQNSSNQDTLFMQKDLTDHLKAVSERSRLKKNVLIIKDAENLSEKQYEWLSDIHNALQLHDIIFFSILFGTKELREQKRDFILNGKDHIIQRYMVKEFSC